MVEEFITDTGHEGDVQAGQARKEGSSGGNMQQIVHVRHTARG